MLMQLQSGGAWTAEAILELARGYQPSAVLAAAAELDVFSKLAERPRTGAELAALLKCDERGLMILLDALVALQLLEKQGTLYASSPAVAALLGERGNRSVAAMVRHQGTCLRRWAQLGRVVKDGQPAQRIPSVRGEAGDLESFIKAMHNISAPVADEVIQAIQPLEFQRLLDVGGGPGTWTAAFLRNCPAGRAVLFDLPDVLPIACEQLRAAGLIERVELVAGDFNTDALPAGADLAWVSAIVHQNSRAQNRALFAKVFQALVPGGRIAIRDILMQPSRTAPVAGALFAVNMLVGTDQGGTFTFEELREDLESAGFEGVTVARQDAGMNAVVTARRTATRSS
jgi:precorrin-6B methylase 2